MSNQSSSNTLFPTKIDDLRQVYLDLINERLPANITQPIRFNHCFARVALDWLFQDVWYNHIETRPAYKALTTEQLTQVIERMQLWLADKNILIEDNQTSLRWRNKL